MSFFPLTSIVRQATRAHSASVIFLHGLGDSGAGWASIADQLSLKLPHIKFIFPNAPNQPVSLNFGMSMPSWYDIKSLNALDANEDEQGLLKSARSVMKLIQAEIDSGIPSNRIVIGGFSQGCAVSLLTLLTSEYKLGGLICLSGYLPLHKQIHKFLTESSKAADILWCHGEEDEVVRYEYGRQSYVALKQLGYNVDFHSFPNMGHSSSYEELLVMTKFLEKTLPPV